MFESQARLGSLRSLRQPTAMWKQDAAQRYIPLISAHGDSLLEKHDDTTYKVIKGEDCEQEQRECDFERMCMVSTLVRCRFSPNISDRDGLNHIKKGDTIQGELQDGWLKIQKVFRVASEDGIYV